MKCKVIQIDFPEPVEITPEVQQLLRDLANTLCARGSIEGNIMYISSTGTPPKMEDGQMVGFHDDFYQIGCKLK